MQMDMKNCTRKPNTHCMISCGTIVANVTCLSNGSWSHVPVCKYSRENMCPDLEIGTLVNCSRRQGEVCQVRCPGGKIMSENVTCSTSGDWAPTSQLKDSSNPSFHTKSKWSIISKCTCSSPNLTKNLETVGNCDDRKIGEKCHLKCANNYSLIGKKAITCLKNTSWSSLPTCSDEACPKPELPEELLFKEDCSSKKSGQTCDLKCRGKLQLLVEKPFTCVNGSRWTKFPSCACFPPKLPAGMTTEESCLKEKIGSTCLLKCGGNYSLIGLNAITCKHDGSWTVLPECRKTSCLKPNLPKPLIFSEDCKSKMVGETCELECLNTEEMHEITCLNNTHWSTFPKCSCPLPSFSEKLKIQEDCSFKKPGEKCKVSCKYASTFENSLYVTCQNNSQWSDEPSCEKEICPLPQLPNYLSFDDDCSYKGIDEQCKLKCKRGGKPIGDPNITCLKQENWSPFPSCTCPVPEIREDLEFVEDCSGKKSGENCKVKCKKELNISGEDFMLCKQDTTWTSQPSCKKMYCKDPELPNFLSIRGNKCSSKKVGDECEVTCKEGGYILGESFIKCYENLTWSRFPSCSCPSPNLKDDIKLIDPCKNMTVGQKCFLKCKQAFSDISFTYITCMNDTKWSNQPACKKNFCKEPTLPSFLAFQDACTSKVPGEECLVKCREAGVILGNPTIKCLNLTHWTKTPECSCPEPLLDDDLVSKENCTHKKIHDRCDLQCKNNKKLIGESFITCQNNLRWSSQPICRVQICVNPLPLRGILEPKDDCFSVTVGNSCSLRCTEGGKIIGPDVIKCLNSTHWTKLPDCTCPKPELPENIEFDEDGDCSNKNRSSTCKIRCGKFHRLIGNNYTTCGENTKWSSFPRCETIYCPKPVFPNGILAAKEDCNLKIPTATCELECKEGGQILGSNFITCIDGIKWSDLPDCTCPPPSLHSELELKEDNCDSKRVNETCKVGCIESEMQGTKNQIICEDSRKWSSLPKCKTIFCPILTLPREVYVTQGDCSSKVPKEKCYLTCKQGGRIIGNNFLECQSNGSWSATPDCTCPKPEMGENLYTTETDGCISKGKNEKCKLSCRNNKKISGDDNIICQNTTKWSPLPRCEEQFCPTPNLSSTLKFMSDCSSKSAFQACSLGCSGGGKVIGDNSITCLSNLTWSLPPVCTCPELTLPREIYVTQGNCNSKVPKEKCYLNCKQGGRIIGNNFLECQSNSSWSNDRPVCTCPKPEMGENLFTTEADGCMSKRQNEKCKLSCKNNMKISGDGNIICQSDTKWSPLPRCEEQFCPSPNISSTLRFMSDCSSKSAYQTCSLGCSGGGKVIGDNSITCLSNLTWSVPPVCTCPELTLPREVYVTQGNCHSKAPKEKCYLNCKQGGRIIGNNFLECLSNSSWSNDRPICTCPEPEMGENLFTTEADGCISKRPNEKCKLSCKNNKKLSGDDSIICQSNTKWGPLPRCEEQHCPTPNLSSTLKLLSNCSSKSANQSCRIGCSEGGRLFRGNTITCLSNLTWSQPPVCTCPAPDLRSDLKGFNCINKLPGETCNLTCKDRFSLPAESFITCSNETKWSTQPECKRGKCGTLIFFLDSVYDGICNVATAGEICYLRCKGGGNFVGNRNFITCGKTGEWTHPRKCFCPPLIPPNEYILKEENCSAKLPGEKCRITCRNGADLKGNDYIECDNSARWVTFPSCALSVCPPPLLPEGVIIAEESCSRKKIGDFCRLACRNGGFLNGLSEIRCTEGRFWSKIPTCICPQPPDTIYGHNCDQIPVGGGCYVSCKSLIPNKPQIDQSTTQGVTCVMEPNRMWNELPDCSCPFPRHLHPFVTFQDDCKGLSSFPVGKVCNVYCDNTGAIFNGTQIVCLAKNIWSISPHCSCDPPPPKPHVNYSNCTATLPGSNCQVSCDRGMIDKTSLFCKPTYVWDTFPTCTVLQCKDPTFKDPLMFGLNCTGLFSGDICKVRCQNDARIIGTEFLVCIQFMAYKWLAEHESYCACHPPDLKDKHILLERDCNNKRRSETCSIRCKDNDVRGNITCLMEKNMMWTSLFKCLNPCPNPNYLLSRNIRPLCPKGDQPYVEGDTCQLQCLREGAFLRDGVIRCLDSGKWSGEPSCSCPPVLQTQHFEPIEDCRKKFDFENCTLRCRQREFKIHRLNNHVTCRLGNWTGRPECERSPTCPPLTVSDALLEVREDCRIKYEGETCKLGCKNNAPFINSSISAITCMPGPIWSAIPPCACESVQNYGNWVVNPPGNCNRRRPNEFCPIFCSQERKYVNIRCLPDGKWTVPDCASSK